MSDDKQLKLEIELKKRTMVVDDIRIEYNEIHSRLHDAEERVKETLLKLKALEKARQRKENEENIQLMGSKTTVLDLIKQGTGRIDDYRYFLKSGIECTVGIVFETTKEMAVNMEWSSKSESGKSLFIGIKNYSDGKKLYDAGFELNDSYNWYGGKIKAYTVKSRRRYGHPPQDILAVKKE